MQAQGIPAIPEARNIEVSSDLTGKGDRADVFESHEHDENDRAGAKPEGPEIQLPSAFDELPIEIRSLTERFLDGLSAKVHPAPLSADQLSQMFQDFYDRAAAQIGVHIASLASSIARDRSSSAKARNPVKGRPRTGSGAQRADSPASNSGGEMLTPSEVADRRKARRTLELKRTALEEAVERRVCERVYDRIWKHRSTDDDARDEVLRSRTAALSLVGIGLKELHMDQDPAKERVRQTAEEKETEIHASLATAREALQLMDDEHFPLGKLQHLTAAHKSIVETLSQLFPSSSSADEILPTLIYTLITSSQDAINVVSNLCFIQRFRGSDKVDGEAAYCLVNLEAAISFLETVDLSSLRSDELPQGPPKSSSRPRTPTSDKLRPLTAQSPRPEVTTISAHSKDKSNPETTAESALSSPPDSPTTPGQRPGMHQRSLSAMMQSQADRIEAGRDNLLSTADKVYDSINGTLENSFKFVFGRFKDQVGADASPLPKTLEDARKLVSSPSSPGEDDDLSTQSGRSSPAISDDPLRAAPSSSEKKVLELLAGRKQLRDRSVDSARSGGSGKRVAFAGEGNSGFAPSAANTGGPMPQAKPPTPQEAPGGAASFMTSMNPLSRFGMPVPSFPRFGRGNSLSSSPAAQSSPPNEKPKLLDELVDSPAQVRPEDAAALEKTRSHVSEGGEDLNAIEALAGLRKTKPPKRRFLEVSSAGELRLGEVEELLLEYRRLAKAIGEAVAM